MSRQAQQIAEMVGAANASDWDADAIAPYVHPEVRIYPAPDFPGPEVYTGHAGAAAFVEEWTSTFPGLRWAIDELIDDGDQVVLLARMVGTSKAGAPSEWRFGAIYSDFREGRFAEVRHFMDYAATREAAGLRAD